MWVRRGSAGADGEVQLTDEQMVVEGDAELGVRQEKSGLPDRLGGDQRVVTAVHVGVEAVSAGPLGGDGEAVVVHALPGGEHHLRDAGAVYELLRDRGGQGRVVAGAVVLRVLVSHSVWPAVGNCMARHVLADMSVPPERRWPVGAVADGVGVGVRVANIHTDLFAFQRYGALRLHRLWRGWFPIGPRAA